MLCDLQLGLCWEVSHEPGTRWVGESLQTFALHDSNQLNVYNLERELTGFGVFHGEKKPEINKKKY